MTGWLEAAAGRRTTHVLRGKGTERAAERNGGKGGKSRAEDRATLAAATQAINAFSSDGSFMDAFQVPRQMLLLASCCC